MNYDIIPMTAEHIPQVAALERKCFSAPWSERMLREHLENECAATLVAQGEDGTVLGYAPTHTPSSISRLVARPCTNRAPPSRA